METFKLEIDIPRSFKSRFIKCKLVLLALMWMQYDEDQHGDGSANYSSPLFVDNSEWWDRNGGSDVEHFRKVSNTARIGAWDEVMSLCLVDLLSPNPTCLHDASYSALVAILMHLVDNELEGRFINCTDQYFARKIAYQSLKTLGEKYFIGTDSFSLTGIEDGDPLMWGLALHYLALEVVAIGDFGMANSDIDEEGIEDFLDNMDDVERAEFNIQLGFLPDGYFQVLPYVEKWTDRTAVLSRLIHRIVYYIFVGHRYDANCLNEIMSIPFNSRVAALNLDKCGTSVPSEIVVGNCGSTIQGCPHLSTERPSPTTFQSLLVAAVYRVGYFITNRGVEEWQESRNWFLWEAFSNLLPFYNKGRKDAAGL